MRVKREPRAAVGDKLERAAEKTTTTSDKPFYLTREVTDDEKLDNFDVLQRDYQEMLTKFANLRKKCDYVDKLVINSEYTKKKVKSKKNELDKKFPGQAKDSGSFESIEHDDTVPEGWKSSWRLMAGFSKGQKIKVYWAPNERFCSSRVEALNYMLNDLGSCQQDIDVMIKGLEEDGWNSHESLPDGWMVSLNQSKDTKRFITKDFHFLKNQKLMLKYMSSHCTEEQISKYLVAFHLKSAAAVSASSIHWLHSDAVPYEWRAAVVRPSLTLTITGFLVISPAGVLIQSMKLLTELTAELDRSDAERFRGFLAREKSNVGKGKKNKENPKARVKREKSIKTEKMEEHRPFSDKENGTRKRRDRSNNLVFQEDSTVPTGWHSAVIEDGFGKRTYYREPSRERVFTGRLDALRTMVKDNKTYPDLAFQFMKKGLAQDGWAASDSLPIGWLLRSKQYKSEKNDKVSVR